MECHGMVLHTCYRKRYNACFLTVMIIIFTLNKDEHLFFIMSVQSLACSHWKVYCRFALKF
jgi:hypothetical protein